MQEEAFPAQASIIWIGELATALDHPGAVRLAEDAGDLHPSRREVDHEQDGEARQPSPVQTSTEKKSAAARTPRCVRRNSCQVVRFCRSERVRSRAASGMLAMVPRLT
jgi:hypothetical protein